MTTYEETLVHTGFQIVDAVEEGRDVSHKYVTFSLGPGQFALPITAIQEIVYDKRITVLPAMATYLAGVIELRGEIINVIDLKKRLHLRGTNENAEAAAFVVIRQGEVLLALQADAIGEVVEALESEVEPLPLSVHQDEELLTHVIKTGNRLITLMDPDKLTQKPATISNEESIMAATTQHNPRVSAHTVTDTIQLVTFSIGSDEYAVNIKDVQEINKLAAITHVPHAPRFVEGVINLRGQVLPVINLRERFSLLKTSYDKNTRVIVIQLADKRLGLIVDAVSEVLRIPSPAVKLPPAEAIGENAGFVSGIAEWNQRLIIVLNLEMVLSHEEVTDLGSVRESIEESLAEPSNN